jgi:hypothetical protein
VGAADGLVFLGTVGTITGYFIAGRQPGQWSRLSPALLAVLLLAGAAVFFGALACAIVHAGIRAIAAIFAAGMVGAVTGLLVGNLDGLLLGAIGGAALGTVLGLCLR